MQSMKAISDVRAAITRQRQQEGRHYYLLGLLCLEVESQRGFQDKRILKRCCGFFVESIRRDRQCPEPYIKLAYLLATMQACSQALPYLQQALALAPEHAEARALQGYIESLPAAPALPVQVPNTSAPTVRVPGAAAPAATAPIAPAGTAPLLPSGIQNLRQAAGLQMLDI